MADSITSTETPESSPLAPTETKRLRIATPPTDTQSSPYTGRTASQVVTAAYKFAEASRRDEDRQ